jgi:hypothetical protein
MIHICIQSARGGGSTQALALAAGWLAGAALASRHSPGIAHIGISACEHHASVARGAPPVAASPPGTRPAIAKPVPTPKRRHAPQHRRLRPTPNKYTRRAKVVAAHALSQDLE